MHYKLNPRGVSPFKFLEHINDNAYKIDLPGEYNVSATNVSDLSHFDVGSNSRMNLFEKGGMMRTWSRIKAQRIYFKC